MLLTVENKWLHQRLLSTLDSVSPYQWTYEYLINFCNSWLYFFNLTQMCTQKRFDTKNDQKQCIRMYTRNIVVHEKTHFQWIVLHMKSFNDSRFTNQTRLLFFIHPINRRVFSFRRIMASFNGNEAVTNGDSRISNGDNHVEEVCPTCFKTIYWPCKYNVIYTKMWASV